MLHESPGPPSAAPSAAPSHPARLQQLASSGITDADQSPQLPASVAEGERDSEKLTKELTQNIKKLDAYSDKLAEKEKDLGAFFAEEVPEVTCRALRRFFLDSSR